MPKRRIKVIAEFSIHPIGSGISVSKYVKAALKAISEVKGVRFETNPMATVLEADDLTTIFKAVSAAHEAVFSEGAERVDFLLRVDDRRDKPRVMEDKVTKVKLD
ncbi:MAG: MTH1187 family thiamine-binding protein [Conexivisphaerales archaeon]